MQKIPETDRKAYAGPRKYVLGQCYKNIIYLIKQLVENQYFIEMHTERQPMSNVVD